MKNHQQQLEAPMKTSNPVAEWNETDIHTTPIPQRYRLMETDHPSTAEMAIHEKNCERITRKTVNKKTKDMKIDKVGAGGVTKRSRRAAKRSRAQKSMKQPMEVPKQQKFPRLMRVAAKTCIDQQCLGRSRPVNAENNENAFLPTENSAKHKKNRRPTHRKNSVNKVARALQALDASGVSVEKKDTANNEASKIHHRRIRANIARQLEDSFVYDEQRAVMNEFEAENEHATDGVGQDVEEDDSVIDEEMDVSKANSHH